MQTISGLSLLDSVASYQNLHQAFWDCSRGKRQTLGFQKNLFGYQERLNLIRTWILSGEFKWGQYREFYVKDPKRRLVMAAPFMDRVVHHAIHRVIEPIFDLQMSTRVFACRKNLGNRAAAVDLLRHLMSVGQNRFSAKLDVAQYFASINHEILMAKLRMQLPDSSIDWLLISLLKSYPRYDQLGCGIPIGNLTSQLFANFYLSSADRIVENLMSSTDSFFDQFYYIRYMDDGVIVSSNRQWVMDASHAYVNHCERELKLQIPFFKRVYLGSDPIPFMGFLMNHDGYKVLCRNVRRFNRKVKMMINKNESEREMVSLSYDSWSNLGEGLIRKA